ncbi:MAG TPA: SGNH/GDSL hydrolase family protein [Solirubrobacteraceae bacterium]|nr:SGNH/GDSL hydrolase family protein [Solirubrobacteraceae bacterium]
MKATYGSGGTPRARGGVIGCVLLFALAISALVLAPAAANARKAKGTQVAPETQDYIALGDSISFGYSQERFNIHAPTEAPAFFEEGVANDALKLLRKATGKKSLQVVNDACPGETSNGLIGENPMLGGEVSTETYEEVEGKPAERFPFGGYQGLGDWHPCKYTFRNHLPLHNGGYFEGTKEASQLEEALATVKSVNPVTEKPTEVKAISLNIGSNDELAAITQCEDEVAVEFGEKGSSKYGSSPPAATETCIVKTALGVTLPHIIKNIEDTVSVLEANYSGPIIVIGFYNPDAFVLSGTDILQKKANEEVEAELKAKNPHVSYANPFPVFNKDALMGKPEKEQEAICKYTEMCNPNVQVKGGMPEGKDGDIHPTVKGYKVLAKLVAAAYAANPAK